MQKLKELLRENNISAEQLSNDLNLSGKARVYEWIRGVRFPNFDTIIKLSDYFNCSIEYMIGRTEDNGQTKFKKNPSFKDQLNKIMKLRNVSQYEMIKNNIVHSGYFSNWKTKDMKPSIDTLIKLADYFKISVDELIGRV